MKKNEPKRLDYFDEGSKHRIVSDFVASYFAHKIISINTWDKQRDEHWFSKEEIDGVSNRLEYAANMAFQLGWKDYVLFENANGSFTMKTEDDRFRGLDELCKKYAGVIETPESERLLAEKKLYPMIMELMKEDRIHGTINLQPYRDMEFDKLAASMERLVKLINNLEKRVSGLEQLAGMIPR